jgi:hypothetical protein
VADGWTGDPLSQLVWWTIGNFAFLFLYLAPVVAIVVGTLETVLAPIVGRTRLASLVASMALALTVWILVSRASPTMWLTFALFPAIGLGLRSKPYDIPRFRRPLRNG